MKGLKIKVSFVKREFCFVCYNRSVLSAWHMRCRVKYKIRNVEKKNKNSVIIS